MACTILYLSSCVKTGGPLCLAISSGGEIKFQLEACPAATVTQSLPHSFHEQVNFTADLSSALDQPVVAKEAPDRSESILIRLHFLSI